MSDEAPKEVENRVSTRRERELELRIGRLERVVASLAEQVLVQASGKDWSFPSVSVERTGCDLEELIFQVHGTSTLKNRGAA